MAVTHKDLITETMMSVVKGGVVPVFAYETFATMSQKTACEYAAGHLFLTRKFVVKKHQLQIAEFLNPMDKTTGIIDSGRKHKFLFKNIHSNESMEFELPLRTVAAFYAEHVQNVLCVNRELQVEALKWVFTPTVHVKTALLDISVLCLDGTQLF